MHLINTQNKERVQLMSTNFTKRPVSLLNIDSDFFVSPDFREIRQKNFHILLLKIC
jgi:hypothetical protein